MSLNLSISPPPAASVKLLAAQYGGTVTARLSSRSYAGMVVIAHFSHPAQACQFAPLAAKLAGHFVTVRGTAVSVPAIGAYSPLPANYFPLVVIMPAYTPKKRNRKQAGK